MLRVPVLAWLRSPHKARLSFRGDRAQAKACFVTGDPDLSLSEHHLLVPHEACLEGGVRDHLAEARVHDHLPRSEKLLASADRPPDLACHGQRVMGDPGEERDITGAKRCLDPPEAVVGSKGSKF
jgi:hypothetical protein